MSECREVINRRLGEEKRKDVGKVPGRRGIESEPEERCQHESENEISLLEFSDGYSPTTIATNWNPRLPGIKTRSVISELCISLILSPKEQ